MGKTLQDKLYIATIAEDCGTLARKFSLGLEVDEFCTAANMDSLQEWDGIVREKIRGVTRLLFHAPFNELVPVSIDPEISAVTLRRYRQACETARRFGIARMVFHTGYLPNTTHPGWYTEQCAAFWREFAKGWPDTQFLLENVFESSPEQMKCLTDGIDCENVRLCFDVGHANCCSRFPVRNG
jgi:sugar phosphate isomerase/epimerase